MDTNDSPFQEINLAVSVKGYRSLLENLSSEIGTVLSANPAEAQYQLKVGLNALIHLYNGATQHRNHLLDQALYPNKTVQLQKNIIDITQSANELSIDPKFDLSGIPIAGWDLSAFKETDSQVQASTTPPIFDPEFVERTVYLLSELAQDEDEEDTTSTLLAVDRLDLLLTLVKAEASRLLKNLEN